MGFRLEYYGPTSRPKSTPDIARKVDVQSNVRRKRAGRKPGPTSEEMDPDDPTKGKVRFNTLFERNREMVFKIFLHLSTKQLKIGLLILFRGMTQPKVQRLLKIKRNNGVCEIFSRIKADFAAQNLPQPKPCRNTRIEIPESLLPDDAKAPGNEALLWALTKDPNEAPRVEWPHNQRGSRRSRDAEPPPPAKK